MSSSARIEVNGKTGIAIVRGFGAFSVLGSQYLLEHGIGTAGEDGIVVIDPQVWYPLEAWLQVLERIGRELGDPVLFQIGQALVSAGNTSAPEIHSALSSLDGAYHRNHRLDGRAMWDPVAQRPLEGIGHYAYRSEAPAKRIRMRCDDPYPCSFDRGIIDWLAKRWDAGAKLTHEPGECRRTGGAACTWRVEWTA